MTWPFFPVTIVTAVFTILFRPIPARAVTVATVGDSLADAVYLGMKLQPDLLKKNGIHLVPLEPRQNQD